MSESRTKPIDIGILDIQCHFPTTFVDQHELEEFDKVGKGKYTVGLGQEKMAISSDREDINSVCLTVLDKLLTKNNIDRKQIGRLEVGTETFLDKSKSVKTYLMNLFKDCNTDIEGVTTSNACYGGTNALLNTINWVQSDVWDGRLGIVIMGDIAVYAKGNARPTGGCGSIALLIGPNAPIVFEPVRSSYMNHVFDFYKPDPTKEYPVVDGGFSLDCYIKSLESSFLGFMNKIQQREDKYINSLNDFDFFCFHSPFAKMVEKAFIHLVNYDIKRTSNYKSITSSKFSLSEESHSQLINKVLHSKDFRMDNTEQNEIKNILNQRKIIKDLLLPSLFLSKNLGNTYVCALYMNLLALIINPNLKLNDKRIFMFSYGSGCAASLFTLKVKGDIEAIKKRNEDVIENLNSRVKIHPKDFEVQMQRKEKLYLLNNYTPETDVSTLREGTYYLTKVDDRWRRYYSKKTQSCNGMEMTFNQLSNTYTYQQESKGFLKRIILLKDQLLGKRSDDCYC